MAVSHFLFSAELLSKCFHFLSILGPAQLCSPSIKLLPPHTQHSARGFTCPGLNLCPHSTFPPDFLCLTFPTSCQISPASQPHFCSSDSWFPPLFFLNQLLRVRHKYCGMIPFFHSQQVANGLSLCTWKVGKVAIVLILVRF